MKLNLAHLEQLHPTLPLTTAVEYGHRAAVALERHQHRPGVAMEARVSGHNEHAVLCWASASETAAELLDRHRVTEDAAEAISLALVRVRCGWAVRRRLQRGEAADWLLRDADGELVALEVSGLTSPDGGRRLLEKSEQAARTDAADKKAACVVELSSPSAALATGL